MSQQVRKTKGKTMTTEPTTKDLARARIEYLKRELAQFTGSDIKARKRLARLRRSETVSSLPPSFERDGDILIVKNTLFSIEDDIQRNARDIRSTTHFAIQIIESLLEDREGDSDD
jgi:hypothetical protein